MEIREQEQLILDIQGDPKQFAQVFDLYYTAIFTYVFHRTGDYEATKDIASETFLKAFFHFKNFSWKGIPISSWLYKIATNETNMFFRKKKYHPESLDSLKGQINFDFIDPQTTKEELAAIEKELMDHDDFINIQLQLKKLNIKYQEVIALRYFEEKSIHEIALILDKKEGTVKSLLSRGIEKLKNLC
jgi:RNA polymerase sigma-70 factor (ECF subfamily)